MNERQIAEIKETWQVAMSDSPECESARSKLIYMDFPALLAYAEIEVANQTRLKMEVLRRLEELNSGHSRVQFDSTVHNPILDM